ncbi:hypothetical protein ACWDR0_16505 [Streptomyces sp. NPDC003691]
MELTETTVALLLKRLGTESGPLAPPPGTDPQMLVDMVSGWYGTPRTLVLDGFADPQVDEYGGAELIALLGGPGVTVRAWAYAGRWVGVGSVRGEGRAVLGAVARRVRPLAGGGPGPGEDWVDRLAAIVGWDEGPRRPDTDWAAVEGRLGTRLPRDYKRMVEVFGDGVFDDYLYLNVEPWSVEEDALLMWAGTEQEDMFCWQARVGDPDGWGVVVRNYGEEERFECSAAELVCRILVEPRHPYSTARYFDTHWFAKVPDEE